MTLALRVIQKSPTGYKAYALPDFYPHHSTIWLTHEPIITRTGPEPATALYCFRGLMTTVNVSAFWACDSSPLWELGTNLYSFFQRFLLYIPVPVLYLNTIPSSSPKWIQRSTSPSNSSTLASSLFLHLADFREGKSGELKFC